MKRFKTALALGLLAVLIVSVAGCTSSNTANSASSGSTQNMAVVYANSVLNDSIKPAFSDVNMTQARVVANASDGARITATFLNSSNNETATISMNVRQFSSVSDATTYFNNQSFGYTLGMIANGPYVLNPASAAYSDATGHAPTVQNTAYKFGDVSFTEVNIGFIMQQGEFITWGTETAVMS